MPKTPIEMMLDGVQWKATGLEHSTDRDSLPYATHEGELELMGKTLKVFRLSDGQAIIEAESLNEFFKVIE